MIMFNIVGFLKFLTVNDKNATRRFFVSLRILSFSEAIVYLNTYLVDPHEHPGRSNQILS